MKLFIILGISVHLVLLSAVFKIYFKSPLEHGMAVHKSLDEPPASRVVLFVGDGLRAQSLYNNLLEERAPFLHSKLKGNSAWGVAHTQVPTESRPGHVAILAGFNEDPSAITKGWQSNPVEYDSVINQSSNAWCWGSPDIVKLFSHGHAPHIYLSYYDSQLQDFSGKESPALLDKWVFEEVTEFIEEQTLFSCSQFCEKGNIIFLHLLGLDVAGHSFKPLSKEYIDNIKVVDDGIRTVTKVIDEFFNDSKTAYIFTSDHGMTNWGSHGDGSEHETNVPFIAYGAGIKNSPYRQDLQQNDIAVLISSLIGINIPVNSNGVVPLNYLNATLSQKSYILYANARQLLEQYLIKHKSMIKNTLPYIFKPFEGLTEMQAHESIGRNTLSLVTEQFEESIDESYALIKLCKSGLKYYHSYYQKILLAFVSTGYVGWIVLVFISITNLKTNAYNDVLEKYKNVDCPYIFQYGPLICGTICIFISYLIYVQQLEYNFYIYFLFPVITWYTVLHNYKKVIRTYGILRTYGFLHLLFLALVYFCGIELLLYTFYKPGALFYIFVVLALQGIWYKRRINDIPVIWIVKQVLLGLAPLIIGIQSDFNRLFQGFAAMGWLLFQSFVANDVPNPTNKMIYNFQLNVLNIAFVNTIFVDFSIKSGGGLWFLNQFTSWMIFGLAPILPLFTTMNFETRLVSTVIAFVTPYTLMSTGCESLFMFLFVQHMFNWVAVEYHIHSLTIREDGENQAVIESKYTDEDTVRRCFYLLSFIMVSFFGVGNIASLNSFNPTWVRCFVTVFSPFTMALLILAKLVLPFLIILMAFRSVVRVSFSQVKNCFLIILLFCNIMVLQFLFLVKDEGSWLEIGLSISRFIVAIVTTIALMLLYGVTGFFDSCLLCFNITEV